MASNPPCNTEQKSTSKLQIYPATNNGVSPFWREKYERDAKKYWDIFYKRHQDKFFKDRHYLGKEWGHYFSGAGTKVILEVGCGVGNTIFPLLATYPNIYVHACDFSPRAINLVKTHKEFVEARINSFVFDMTSDDLSKLVTPCSVDVVTMIFVLSAVSPDKMAVVLQNIRRVLKPNGYVLFRDYATGDLAQERFTCKDQKISENFYVRGDGTRAFYFSEEYLRNLFEENGFHTEELGLRCKQVENRSRELVMNRRWIQAVFRSSDAANGSNLKLPVENGVRDKEHGEDEVLKNASGELAGEVEVDMSDGVAQQMFGISFSEEVQDINFGTLNMKIRVLPKEYQHTCKSTGLMLWESARLMASILAENPTITSTKRVLELGSGSSGLCSIVAAHYAKLVVTTDGDTKALDLLTQNVASNTKQTTYSKVLVRKLEWGNEEEIGEIKELCEGFDVIIGTDVTYVGETILPLFMTAKRLISCSEGLDFPCFLLCHTLRRVDEPTIISTAARAGFILVDRWPSEGSVDASRSIVGSWVSRVSVIPSTALSILCFRRVEEFMSTSTGSNKGCWVKYDTNASFDWKEIRF